MAEADQFISSAKERMSPRRDEVINRLLLCSIVAGVEAVVAFALVFGSAATYHLTVLHQTAGDFDALFYFAFGLVAALFHATFSAIACSRFLEQNISVQGDVRQAFFGWTAATALTLLTAFLFGRIGDLSRVSLTTAYLIGVPATLTVQNVLHRRLNARIRRGELRFDSVAVIGKRNDVLSFLLGAELWRRGQKLQDILYLEDARTESGDLTPKTISDFAARNVKRGTAQIVFVGNIADLDEFGSIVTQLKRYALNLLYAPASTNRTLKLLDVVAIGPNNSVRFVRTPMNQSSVLAKRVFDILLSSIGLVILAPLFAAVAAVIAIESRGPVIYRQARRGFNGETFMIWKFRSMRVTESGYQMKQAQKDDPRITRIGRFIRATSIDELPQLVNVLVGQMSLVGPRPHAVLHDEELSRSLASYAHRQRIKPGITGWAQVNGFRGETTTHDQIAGRTEHDIHYIDNWSPFLDFWILVLTIFSPAARKNAR